MPGGKSNFTPRPEVVEAGTLNSLSDKAYRLLREKIVTLELPPSSTIDEMALIEELGIGRTPIREALRRLALENLVVIRPRRGMFVADISVTDLQKIFEVRAVLESYCARLAAERASAEQLARLETLFQEGREMLDGGDNRALIAFDQRFHEMLYQAAGNEFLAATLERLYWLSLRLWYLCLNHTGRVREAVEEHGYLIEALKNRDADRAEAIMRQHITDFQATIKAAL